MDAALNPILEEARQRAPVRTGALRKSLGKKVKTYRRSRVTVGIVGVRFNYEKSVKGKGGKKKKIIPRNYGHLVEKGSRGKPGKPFLRPALQAKFKQAISIYGSKLKVAIDAEWMKR